MHPPLHEVHLPEAPPVHPLSQRYEAAQLRAHGQHNVVQGADTQNELVLQCLSPSREAEASEKETKNQDGEEDHRTGG